MSTTEIEKLAAQGAEMPNSLNGAEQLLFLSLRQLYALFRSGKIKKDIAKIEKTKILREYDKYSLYFRAWDEARRRETEMSKLLHKMKETECDVCKEFFRIHSGIKSDTET